MLLKDFFLFGRHKRTIRSSSGSCFLTQCYFVKNVTRKRKEGGFLYTFDAEFFARFGEGRAEKIVLVDERVLADDARQFKAILLKRFEKEYSPFNVSKRATCAECKKRFMAALGYPRICPSCKIKKTSDLAVPLRV